MITFWGVLVSLFFGVAYLGQSVSSGMEGRKGKILQWMCWVLASTTMLICYLLTDTTTG